MGKRHSTGSRGKSWWAAQVAAQQASGVTQREFCASRGLSPSSFARWKRRIRDEEAAVVVAERSRFIELDVPALSTPLVRVNVGRLRVDFETLPPPAWVAELAAYEAARC